MFFFTISIIIIVACIFTYIKVSNMKTKIWSGIKKSRFDKKEKYTMLNEFCQAQSQLQPSSTPVGAEFSLIPNLSNHPADHPTQPDPQE